MLLSTLKEPPKKGSLRESLLIVLILRKEAIEYARVRALAQILVNKEKGHEAFEDYKKTAFPWVQTQKSRDRADHVRILEDEIKRGVLGVRPLWDKQNVRSRMKAKIIEGASSEPAQRPTEDLKKLYSKLGSIVPK